MTNASNFYVNDEYAIGISESLRGRKHKKCDATWVKNKNKSAIFRRDNKNPKIQCHHNKKTFQVEDADIRQYILPCYARLTYIHHATCSLFQINTCYRKLGTIMFTVVRHKRCDNAISILRLISAYSRWIALQYIFGCDDTVFPGPCYPNKLPRINYVKPEKLKDVKKTPKILSCVGKCREIV